MEQGALKKFQESQCVYALRLLKEMFHILTIIHHTLIDSSSSVAKFFLLQEILSHTEKKVISSTKLVTDCQINF